MSGTIVYLDICALKRLRRAFERRDQMRVEVARPDQFALDQENPS